MQYLSARLLLIGAISMLSACASMPGREPVHVAVAGIESLPSEDMEARMLVKLRVQNPNDAPLDYDGVYLKLSVQGKTFATGVSSDRGTISRFGEVVIQVPVTISMMRAAFNVFGLMSGGVQSDKIHYELYGRLGGSTFGSTSFTTEGDLALPAN